MVIAAARPESLPRPLAPPRNALEEAICAIWRDVLQRPDIGVFDNFFDLDGHSLLVIRVVSRIRKTLDADVPVKDFFEAPTVAALAARIAAKGAPARPPLVARPPGANVDPVLSFDQQRVWLETQLRPGLTYNVHGRRRLVGDVDVAVLEASIRAILARHDTLRTRFPVVEGRLTQVVGEVDQQWRLPFVDASAGPDDAGAAARRLADEQASTPFDLAAGPLFRCLLVKVGDGEHVLSVTMHHIVSDAWSVGVFLRELSALYAAGGDVDAAGLPELDVQYRDYAMWQRDWIASDAVATQLDYWREHLAGAPPALALPTKHRPSAADGAVGVRIHSRLPEPETEALHALCRRHGTTAFTAQLAALAVVLRRWSGQQDLVIGAPIANRTDGATGHLIGFFVNTLPIRVDLSADPTFGELLQRVRRATLDAYGHGDVPFDLLVKELQPPRDPTRTPLFQVILNMIDTGEGGEQFPGIAVETLDGPPLPSKFDLMLNVRNSGDTFDFELAFHGERYDADLVATLLAQFTSLLGAAAVDPDRGILDYPLDGLDASTAAAPPPAAAAAPAADLTAGQAVTWHAAHRPDAVAAVDSDGTYTYLDLHRAADRVAHRLGGRDASEATRVGIVRRPGAGLLAAVLGCERAGRPFVIIDRAAGLGTSVVLDPRPGAPAVDDRTIDVSQVLAGGELPALSPEAEPAGPRSLDDPASGQADVSPADRCAVLGGSPELLLSGLRTASAAGATMLFPDSTGAADVAGLVRWLAGNAVTVVWVNPPLLRALAAAAAAGELPALRYAFVENRGDFFSHDVFALRRVAPACRSIGIYRPGFGGQPLASFPVPATWSEDAAPRVPLGRATDDRVEIVNGAGQRAAVGEVGVVLAGGHETGDLVRRWHDGTIEYVGDASEADDLDPTETIAALLERPDVRAALVIAFVDVDGRSMLAGYVASGDEALTANTIRNYLATQVPEYLVPDGLVLLDHLPLTPDGDYDVAALPEPEWESGYATAYVAPRTPLERQLVEIFQELLEVEQVGVHNTFFELNGFSLLATQLASRIRETYHVELSLRNVFEAPTVEGLAQLIVSAQAERADGDALEALLAELE